VLSNLQWRGDERVLDVGCGAGLYYGAVKALGSGIEYFGLDFSPGMLQNHPGKSVLTLARAQNPPFDDDTFDVVMANHMIYHLPNIDHALTEFRRILKPHGVLIAATNSLQSMPELQVLMRRAILLLTRTGGSQIQPPAHPSELFALENGTRQLARHFYAVVRHDLPSRLVFPEIEPIMKYLESTRTLRESQLPEDVSWEDVMMIMEQQITHLVNHLGEMVVNKLTGVLVASDDGGFIHDFVKIRNEVLA
jgi:SAM-dependent methyltransferase